MLRGTFQRAAVTICLMVGLLAPFGICRQMTRVAEHGCCASEPTASVVPDCCVARPVLPAVVNERILPNATLYTGVLRAMSLAEIASSYEAAPMTVVGRSTSPPGASVLRI
jgi:hypothetical protein